jgi:uncharacterized phage protein (TIGR02218 family)
MAALKRQWGWVAIGVKVTRLDGFTIGFTSLNRDLTISGVTYKAEDSVGASAVTQSLGAGVDNFEVMGLLRDNRITTVDLLAGLYNGATIELLLCNWQDLTQGTITVTAGTWGETTFSDGVFKAEFRSRFQRLKQEIGQLTSPVCRVKDLGDSECKFVLVNGTHINSRLVHSVQSAYVITFDSDANVDDFYTFGKCLFTTGGNINIVRHIKDHALVSGRAEITLAQPFPFEVVVGQRATLTVGCDRLPETCRVKFSNIVNIRAEPYTPQTDQILKRGRRG